MQLYLGQKSRTSSSFPRPEPQLSDRCVSPPQCMDSRRRRSGNSGHSRRSDGSGLRYDNLFPVDEEIRLLHMRWGSSGRAKHRLETVSLRRSPRHSYVALSYPWGHKSDGDSYTVWINNGRRLSVSSNLAQAMNELHVYWRHHASREPLRVWIDQICINQADEVEKAGQVQLMGQIYQRARRVFIYLPVRRPLFFFDGRDRRRSSRKVEEWEKYSRWHHRNMFPPSLPQDTDSHIPFLGKKTRDFLDAWMNVHTMVTSPWWSRAWVLQEFMLAGHATFLIDGLSVSWYTLHAFLRPFFDAREQHIEDCEMISEHLDKRARRLIRNLSCLPGFSLVRKRLLSGTNRRRSEFDDELHQLAESPQLWALAQDTLQIKADRGGHADLGPHLRLSTLISHSRKRQSLWNRDKLYSILGLTNQQENYGIEINYPADRETVYSTDIQMLTKIASAIFVAEQRLDILAIPSGAQWDPASQPYEATNSPHRLPSWAPDWFKPLNELPVSDQYHFRLWDSTLPGYRSRQVDENWGNASADLQPVFSFLLPNRGHRTKILQVRGLYVVTLGHAVDDDEQHSWSRFVGHIHWMRSRVEIATSNEANVNDEVWVVFGCDKPLTLRRVGRGQVRCLLGPAKVIDPLTETPSGLHDGSLARRYQRGEAQHHDLLLV